MSDDKPDAAPPYREFLVTMIDEFWSDYRGRGMGLDAVVAAESRSYRRRYDAMVVRGGLPAEDFARNEGDLVIWSALAVVGVIQPQADGSVAFRPISRGGDQPRTVGTF